MEDEGRPSMGGGVSSLSRGSEFLLVCRLEREEGVARLKPIRVRGSNYESVGFVCVMKWKCAYELPLTLICMQVNLQGKEYDVFPILVM